MIFFCPRWRRAYKVRNVMVNFSEIGEGAPGGGGWALRQAQARSLRQAQGGAMRVLRGWVAGALAGWIGLLAGTVGLSGQVAQWRIATVAPPGSSFHRNLEDLQAQWAKAPGGGVGCTLYPGTQGGETQIVRRMRVNQIQGAMLTAIGLSQIDESVTALQLLPNEFQNWEEVDHVRDRLSPQLEAIFARQGYVVLFWGDAGWVRFFSVEPIAGVADLRSRRVFASVGTPKALNLMKRYYNPVELEPDKILLSLRNGMIDTVPVPPFLANFTQVATKAGTMLDLRWAPVVGAMVVTRRAWEQLPAETREYILRTSKEAGEKVRRDSRREDDEAIAAMVEKQGLKVTRLSPEAEAQWMAEAKGLLPKIRGEIVPEAMFDEVMRALEEFREGHR